MSKALRRPDDTKDVCGGCGVNYQVWPYAFGLEYRRIRVKFFGDDSGPGWRQRFPGELELAWRMYESLLEDLRGMLIALGAKSKRNHTCAS